METSKDKGHCSIRKSKNMLQIPSRLRNQNGKNNFPVMKYHFSFDVFQPFKNVKIFLSLPASQKQAGSSGRFALRAVYSSATTVIKD